MKIPFFGDKRSAKSIDDRDNKWETYDYRIAHHPTCSNFDEHFYHFASIKWCRGCVMMYSGYVLGIPLAIYLLGFATRSIYLDTAFMLMMIIPTIISAFIKPIRPIRDVTRFLLGLGVVYAFGIIIKGIIVLNLVVSGFVLWLYIFLSGKLSGMRSSSNHKVCKNCDQYQNPRCDGFKDYYDRKMVRESGIVRLDVYAE